MTHPFTQMRTDDPYCATCNLPADNARHRLVPDQLADLVAAVHRAAEGDSNDEEIEAYRDALDEALSQLGREDLR